MKQPSKQHRGNRNKGGRRSGGGGGGGHSANRVYDSSGPEGKVRGTAQQIIDKYSGLARDAMLAGDRIVAENFYQHAEHYQRILVTIQAAEAEERERRLAAQQAQQAQQQERRSDHQANGGDPGNRGPAPARDEQPQPRQDAESAQPDSLPRSQENDSGGPELVKTPEQLKAEERQESEPRKPRRTRTKTAKDTDGDQDDAPAAEAASPDAEAAPKRRGRPRKTPPPEEAEIPG